MRLYLQHTRTPEQIAQKFGLPIDEVENTISRGMKKVLLTSKDVLATKVSFSDLKREREVLLYQLSTLRERFKYELTNKELTARYHRLNVPVTSFSFSLQGHKLFLRDPISKL